MRNRLRWLTLRRLVALLAFVGIFVIAVRAPVDTDTFWHLRAGEWQVSHRALLRVDLFSQTRYGEPWFNQSWLSQIVLYGVYTALGDAGLALYTAVLAVAGMAFVYPQMRANALVNAFVMVLAAAAAAVFWTARPQMMSFFLSAVVLYLLWLFFERGIDRLWVIPALMILWANLHGGFAIGFILMVLSLLGEFLRWAFEDIPETRGAAERSRVLWRRLAPARRIAVVGLVSAVAVSVNPYGPEMLLYPFQTVSIGVLRAFIQEWASPNFHQPQTWPFIWLLLGTLVFVGLSPRRLGWRDGVMVAGTAYSALLAGRNVATFAIVAAPVLATHLDDWLTGAGVRFRLDRQPEGIMLALNWTLLLLVLLAGALRIATTLAPSAIAEEKETWLPVAAADYLEAADLPGPIFNSYNWGGYLIWQTRDYPVFVDGRTDLYGDELLREFLSTYRAQAGWEERLDEAGINTVFVEGSSPLASVLAVVDGWERVYEDDMAVLYVREGAGGR
jgi:hypothetical protein